MKFHVENLSGLSFEIEVDNNDTLLEVKQKIEKSHLIPVSKQTLIVDGTVILRDDLNVEQCKIVQDSRLQLKVSADDHPNQYDDQMPQSEQSPPPWITAAEFFDGKGYPLREAEIEQLKSYHSRKTQWMMSKVQDSPTIVEDKNNQSEIINIQDSPPMNVERTQEISKVHDSHLQLEVSADDDIPNHYEDQMPQTEQFPAPWMSAGECFEWQDLSLTEEEIRKINSYQTSLGICIQDSPLMNVERTQEISEVQDLPVMFGSSNKNQVPHQTDQSPASESVKGIPVKKRSNKNQVPKIQDLRVKKRSNMKILTKTIDVIVRLHSGHKFALEILVTVNATDEVRTLRDEMAQRQQRGMKLPQDGYFLMHKKELLNEYESYEWNGVQDSDTIVLVPRQL